MGGDARGRNCRAADFFSLIVFFILTVVDYGSRREMFLVSMRKSFKDSIKGLEADIQHANTL